MLLACRKAGPQSGAESRYVIACGEELDDDFNPCVDCHPDCDTRRSLRQDKKQRPRPIFLVQLPLFSRPKNHRHP